MESMLILFLNKISRYLYEKINKFSSSVFEDIYVISFPKYHQLKTFLTIYKKQYLLFISRVNANIF